MSESVVAGRLSNTELPIAWHIGRMGEVAGGMTQVVNSYRSWSFDNMKVRVIVSRDGSRGLRAMGLFLRATAHVLALRDPGRNMLVVHLSQGGSFVREGVLLHIARWRGFGVVAHLHGSRFVDFARRHPQVVGAVLRAATKVVVLSDATRAVVCDFVPAHRVELVPNAVPEGEGGAKERVVLFGGAVGRRKGVDVLLEAWRQLGGADAGWMLEIAGPVTEPGLVSQLPAAVRLLGALSHGDLMRRLDRSSIAVLPSRDEAMPMFILEAMARRNCVVSTRVGGIPAILSDGAGLMVEAGNVIQLAEALKQAMTNDTLRESMMQTGFGVFRRRFSADAVYPRVESLWRGVLEAPVPSP